MDETYVKVKGEWVYLYRAIDKHGKTLDFMLSKRRNKAAATKFFARALEVNGLPRKDCHRQKRRQHCWHQSNKQNAERLWLPNPDRDGQAEIPQ